MNKQEQDKQIIENAPVSSTMIETSENCDFEYVRAHDCLYRSLADIAELVALRDEIAEKDKSIYRLTKQIAELKYILNQGDDA